MYIQGIGVDKNYQKAYEYFEKSSAQGHKESQIRIDILQSINQTGQQKYIDANDLYECAVVCHDPEAQYKLALFYKNKKMTKKLLNG